MKDRKKLLSNKTSSPRNVVGDLRLTQPLYKQEISSFNTAKSAGDSRQKLSGMTPLFNSNAFTLIELLVVVLIIGILSAIALPQYQKVVEKARAMQAVVIVKAIGDAQEAYYLANGEYTENLDDLDIDVPGQDYVYGGLKRKTFGVFDFGTSSTAGDGIAISNRWPNETDRDGAHYMIRRFSNDANLYCVPGFYQDPYRICKSLSGGKTTTINGNTYYVIQ